MPRSVFPALLLLSLIWSGSYAFIKVLIEDFGPWTIVCLRSSLGLLVIAAAMTAMRKPFGFGRTPWLPVIVMALVNTCIPWAIIGYSETRLDSGIASVLNATTPIWSLALGAAFWGATARRAQWIGTGLALVGLAALLSPGAESVHAVDALGFAGMLAASLFYGAGAQMSKRLLATLSTYQTAFFTLFFTALGSGIMSLATENVPYERLAVPANLSVLAGLGIFGSGFAYLLFYWIVHKGGPTIATTVTYLLPVFSLVWGYALLGENVRWSMLAGLALILAGVFLSGKPAKKKRPDKALAV